MKLLENLFVVIVPGNENFKKREIGLKYLDN